MDKGTLVEIRVQGMPRLAVVDRPEGKKNWVVVDEHGQSYTIHPRQVTYTVGHSSYQPGDIPEFWQTAQAYQDPGSLEVAWELMNEAGEPVDPASLALLLFSDQRPELCYAAYRMLSEDKIFFKQKGERYEPRPPAQVNDIRHQLEREAQRLQEWEGFIQRLQQALKRESIQWEKSDRPRLEALEKYALFGDEASQRFVAQEVLTTVGKALTVDGAFQLLVDLGLWSIHENLALHRSQLPTDFSDEVLAMAHQCQVNPPPDPDPDRLDLRHLKVYTIDDESTREIDDGLSVETLDNDRQRLWIHIADPTRWLVPGDPLELEARRRCTTVYLPTGIIPMFPPDLATGPMSLNQGKVCCALSFGVVLSEAGQIEDYCIRPSVITPTYRLTYEDVDEMLDLGIKAEGELHAIASWAKQRHQWRASQGAISIRMPESSIKVSGDDIIIDVLEDSTARQMVAEMMILAGEIAAAYGQTHNLAIPFRSQPQPDLPPDEELLQLPNGWVRDCAIRRCMPRSEIGLSPARHATLGLDSYSQVTSPIRRYTDLLAHFQIKAHLRGDPAPFSSEKMTELTQGASAAAYEATLVERQTKRYWALEYLRRHESSVWPAMLLRWLREGDSLGLIILEDLGLELAMRFNRQVELGEHLQVRVSSVNPRQDFIQFTEVAIEPSETSVA